MIDAWKNKHVFKEQLLLNEKELDGNYPTHWSIFIKLYNSIKHSSVLDIGCGAGVYYELFKRHFPDIQYTGVDYSEDAINLAKATWGDSKSFFTKDFWDFTEKDVIKYDNVLMGALLDVLPNGDEALSFILSLRPNSLFVQRMEITSDPSYTTEYKAYNKITTYQYHHNIKVVESIVANNGYKIYSLGANNYYMDKL